MSDDGEINWIMQAQRRGEMLRCLLDHIQAWAADEDGIPEWMWDDYCAALMIAGQTDTPGWDSAAAARGMCRLFGPPESR